MTNQAEALPGYVGADILEVMDEAHNYNDFLVRMLLDRVADARSIVDFGAGQGAYAARLVSAGLDVACVEPDAKLRRAIAAKGLPAYAEMPPDAGLDLIYSLNVLEHLADDGEALRVLRRSLKPGGTLLLYLPAFMSLFSSFDWRIGHYRRYTRRDLTRKLEAAGFVVAETRYVDSLGYLAGLLYRFFELADGGLNRPSLILYDRLVFPVSLILDKIVGRFVGKNVLAVAHRPA